MRVVASQVVKHDWNFCFLWENAQFEIALIVRRASELACHMAVILDDVFEVFPEQWLLAKVAVLLCFGFLFLFLRQLFQTQVWKVFLLSPKALFVRLSKVFKFCGFANWRLLLFVILIGQKRFVKIFEIDVFRKFTSFLLQTWQLTVFLKAFQSFCVIVIGFLFSSCSTIFFSSSTMSFKNLETASVPLKTFWPITSPSVLTTTYE